MSSQVGLRGASSRVAAVASSSPACAAPPVLRNALPLRRHGCHSAPAFAPTQQHQGRGRLLVTCMAHPRRVAKVASQIQREIGEMFVSDPVIQAAICPERKLGDDTLSAVASITNTYVSNDLQVVKVYVSVYSDDYGKRVAILNLQRLEPYVRRRIGQRVQLRLTPEIRFVYDDSEEEADLVERVIGRDEVERYREEIESEMSGASPAGREQAQQGEERADGEEEEEGEYDEDEYDEDEYDEDPDELPQTYPDPFADMFVGDRNQELVQPRRGGRGRGQQGQAQGEGQGR